MAAQDRLEALARTTGLAVGLVCDPTAEPGERWLVTIGLDASAVAADATDAVDLAFAELVTTNRLD